MPAPDLSIDEDYLVNTAEVVQRTFTEGSCSPEEGCIDALGDRKLLRFSLRTPNTGAGGLFLGDPTGNELFQYSPCHDHYHFQGYAEYRLLDDGGNELALGHKQAFCLLDYDPLEGTTSDPQYDCSYQGISKGWSDIYESSLPCQWVESPTAGRQLQLHIRLNYEPHVRKRASTTTSLHPDRHRADRVRTAAAPTTPSAVATTSTPAAGATKAHATAAASMYGMPSACGTASCATRRPPVGGCTLNEGTCCTAANSCGLANNDVCDCEGTQAWDTADCTSCLSSDPECANVDTCPNGCAAASMQPGCCAQADDCGYANDGWCDCDGTAPWDFAAAATVSATSPNAVTAVASARQNDSAAPIV